MKKCDLPKMYQDAFSTFTTADAKMEPKSAANWKGERGLGRRCDRCVTTAGLIVRCGVRAGVVHGPWCAFELDFTLQQVLPTNWFLNQLLQQPHDVINQTVALTLHPSLEAFLKSVWWPRLTKQL
jgi:hypothetical protein